MRITTKKLLILSLGLTFLALGAMSFFFLEIRAEGIRLEDQIAILTESKTKESAYLRLVRLANETEAERAALAKNFFKEEGDSITFLGEIETLASELGITLKTDALEKKFDKDKNQESISITFVYEGPKHLIFNFSKLMELTPYHSKVESLSLQKTSGGSWSGRLTISITINQI
jgi:hypothetical protein